jgi:hypothetical protein
MLRERQPLGDWQENYAPTRMQVKVEMSKKHLFNLAILMALAISLTPWMIVEADEPPIQNDYIQEIGEKYIFVMLSTDDPSIWAADIQDENIRSMYSKSGLYIKGESLEPLWAVEWYSFRVNISSDGKYLVRWGDWPIITDYDALAFAFYENGQEIKRYEVKDLVISPSLLSESTSHYEWEETSSFDAEQRLLWVRTLNKEEYTFDITTGKITKKILPPTEVMSKNLSLTQIIIVVCSMAVFILTIVFARELLFRRIKS